MIQYYHHSHTLIQRLRNSKNAQNQLEGCASRYSPASHAIHHPKVRPIHTTQREFAILAPFHAMANIHWSSYSTRETLFAIAVRRVCQRPRTARCAYIPRPIQKVEFTRRSRPLKTLTTRTSGTGSAVVNATTMRTRKKAPCFNV